MKVSRLITWLLAISLISLTNQSNTTHHKRRHHRRHRVSNNPLHERHFQRHLKRNIPQIGHKLELQRLSRYGRVLTTINKPNHWDKIPFKLQTYNEPTESQYYQMPTLANGFMGTTAKNTSLYINGLYNGEGSESHRVRIPSLTAVEAIFSIPTTETRTYTFNCRTGVYTTETVSDLATMTQHMYVHRSIKNLIVNEVRVKIKYGYPVSIKLYNITRMEFDYDYVNRPVINPNRYSYYKQRFNPENMTYEQRVVQAPTYNQEYRFEENDGV